MRKMDDQRSQKEKVADRIKEAMQDGVDGKPINIRRLSQLSHVSDASIYQYRTAEYVPGPQNAEALATVLNVNPDWLRGLEAPKGDEIIEIEILPDLKKLTVRQREMIREMIRAFIVSNESEHR